MKSRKIENVDFLLDFQLSFKLFYLKPSDIRTNKTKIRDVWLSVISELCLFVARLQPTLYNSSLFLTRPDIWFSTLFVWSGQKHCPMSANKYHKNLCLVTSIFTKLSQIVCKIGQYIRLGKLGNAIWLCCVF